jgi:hypothetical protein
VTQENVVVRPTQYLVVRNYHGKRRVVFISEWEDDARQIYTAEREKMRDGAVVLWKCEGPIQLDGAHGGYNRTKW